MTNNYDTQKSLAVLALKRNLINAELCAKIVNAKHSYSLVDTLSDLIKTQVNDIETAVIFIARMVK